MKALTLDRHALGPLGFGGGGIGNLHEAVDEEVARTTIVTALRLGIRYFDTAPHYGFGLSEKRLGQVLGELDTAGEVVLSTKIGRKLTETPAANLASRRQGFVTPEPYESEFDYTYDAVLRTFEASSRRLRRDSVDLLLVHDIGRLVHGAEHPGRFSEFMEGGYRAMHELRECGAVGAIGLAVNETDVAQEALEQGDFDLVMLGRRYTLLEQDALDGFLPLCRRRGVEVIVAGPCSSAILATGIRSGNGGHYNYQHATEAVQGRVAAIERVCAAHRVPLAAAALQFPLAHPQVLTVVAGMARPEQVVQAVAYLRIAIPAALWRDLRTLGLIRADAPVPQESRRAELAT
jgi:D-threo-aldose 1-dehydrogenase